MNKSVNLSSSLANSGDGFMGKIKHMTSSISWTYIAIAIVIIIVIVGMYFMFKNQLSSVLNPTYKPNSEHVPVDGMANGPDVELLFFSTSWCVYCKQAKPEWEQLVAEYDGKTINGRKVIFTNVDCTTETPDVNKMMDQYKVEGFPTIKLIKDGQVISYDAKPTKATMMQFLNTAV